MEITLSDSNQANLNVDSAISRLKSIRGHIEIEQDGVHSENYDAKGDIDYIRDLLEALKDPTKLSTISGSVIQSVVPGYEEGYDNDLADMDTHEVPREVKEWLETTFMRRDSNVRRMKSDPPKFKSVANAIRTGIFFDRLYRKSSFLQMRVVPHEVVVMLEHINEWSFDIFEFTKIASGSPLFYIGKAILTNSELIRKLRVPYSTVESMLIALESGYASRQNPYHNNIHAADVMHTVHRLVDLNKLNLLALVMAAAIHDFDHRGTTNSFHVNSRDTLATLYNDKSVLENHHVSAFFRMMQDKGCDVFINLSVAEYQTLRQLLIECVLHTDMTMHFKQIKNMRSMLRQARVVSQRSLWGDENLTGSGNGTGSAAQNTQQRTFHQSISLGSTPTDNFSIDRMAVLCLMLHASDVSHPCKEWKLHINWASRCLAEFFAQGDRERELGLEYSPLCDRNTIKVPQSQRGFIDYIVAPTFNLLGDTLDTVLQTGLMTPDCRLLLSGATCTRPWIKFLDENKDRWSERIGRDEKMIDAYDDISFTPSTYMVPTKLDSDKTQPVSTSSTTRSSTDTTSADERREIEDILLQQSDGNDLLIDIKVKSPPSPLLTSESTESLFIKPDETQIGHMVKY